MLHYAPQKDSPSSTFLGNSEQNQAVVAVCLCLFSRFIFRST